MMVAAFFFFDFVPRMSDAIEETLRSLLELMPGMVGRDGDGGLLDERTSPDDSRLDEGRLKEGQRIIGMAAKALDANCARGNLDRRKEELPDEITPQKARRRALRAYHPQMTKVSVLWRVACGWGTPP